MKSSMDAIMFQLSSFPLRQYVARYEIIHRRARAHVLTCEPTNQDLKTKGFIPRDSFIYHKWMTTDMPSWTRCLSCLVRLCMALAVVLLLLLGLSGIPGLDSESGERSFMKKRPRPGIVTGTTYVRRRKIESSLS